MLRDGAGAFPAVTEHLRAGNRQTAKEKKEDELSEDSDKPYSALGYAITNQAMVVIAAPKRALFTNIYCHDDAE